MQCYTTILTALTPSPLIVLLRHIQPQSPCTLIRCATFQGLLVFDTQVFEQDGREW